MKIGFSSLSCPAWDLQTIVTKAAEWGYQGVELRGLLGELHLPLVPELAADPQRVRRLFDENNVELVCLGSSATLDSKDQRELERQKGAIVEFVELAGKLGCPYVRIMAGEVQPRDNERAALSRIAEALISLVPTLVRHKVTLLVENGGDFLGSQPLWFLVDAVAHPTVKACWSQCYGRAIRERATISIPRLGHKIGITHLCDAKFTEEGLLTEYTPLGEGDVEIPRMIELLKGVVYRGYLMFEWPLLWDSSLTPPDAILPSTAEFLRERIEAKQEILSAYKGDKRPPKFSTSL